MAMRSGPIERNCKTAKGKDILYDMYQMMKTVVILRALFCFVLFCFVFFFGEGRRSVVMEILTQQRGSR